MQTKHLCVFIHIRIKGEVGTVNFFTDHSFLDPFCYYLCYAVLSVPCRLGKG